METVNSPLAPKAIGPYSQAIVAGKLLFTSGQIGLDPQSGAIAEGGITKQTEQAIANLKNILAEAGTDISKVVKTTCFLADMNDFAIFNKIYAEHFTSCPARSCVSVKALPMGALCEIEAVVSLE